MKAKPILLLIAVMMACGIQKVSAQYSEYEIKAVLIRTIMKRTVWSEDSFDKSGKMVVSIYGSNPFGSVMENVFRGVLINNRVVEVKEAKDLKELKGSHVIFVSRSEEANICRIMDYIGSFRKNSVLTFGDKIEDFCERGGIVQIHPPSYSYYYTLNLEAANDVGLVVDAKVMSIAEKIVKTDRSLCR